MTPETKYKGSIKLSAIGDALGWITEFEQNTQSLVGKYGTERIDRFYSWRKNVGGRFYGFVDTVNAGSYSDDTQLLLSVARSIKADGTVDNEYFSKIELANWLDYARGAGRTVKTAADKIQRKSSTWYNNFYSYKVNDIFFDYRDSGANGAAMRVLPIALANLGDFEKIKEEIFCNSIITHGHPRAIIGAILYGYAVNQIITIKPEYFSWENYIIQIGTELSHKLDVNFIQKKEIKGWIEAWDSSGRVFKEVYNTTIVETQDLLRTIYVSLKQNCTVRETLQKIGCFASATKGSGIATVIAGIYLTAKFHSKPLEAIIESVNSIGADTDSIASFVGGLIGALHGQSIIPNKWKNVQDIDYLDSIAERLLAISEDRYKKEECDLSSMKLKRLNKPEIDNFITGEEVEFIPLGKGKIISIDRQKTITKGKYNLLLEVVFEKGQTILLSKLFNGEIPDSNTSRTEEKLQKLLDIAGQKLNHRAFNSFNSFINYRQGLNDIEIDMLMAILMNEE